MTYKATGKPPGRPRKDGKPAGSVPDEPKPKDDPKRHEIRAVVGREEPIYSAPACSECHPEGWPKGWTAYGCEHGIWARRV